MEPICRRVTVTVRGQRIHGVVVGHRSEADAPVVASVDYGGAVVVGPVPR